MTSKLYFLITIIMIISGFGSEFQLFAQSEQEDKSRQIAEQPPATIEDMAWLAGHWRGNALGGIAEEIWSQPAANSMMGVYRLIKDNKIAFYEIVTIVEEPEGLILRLKHFNADLTGWEEKDVAMEFPLKRLTDKEAIFDGISFYRISEDSMKVIVLSEERGGEVKELKFSYSRVKDW